MKDVPAVARVVTDDALAGDMQAANILMSRVAPPIKAEADRVEFDHMASARALLARVSVS